ncbi:2-dehydropantoate 2-reductase family protein [Bacillus clarus]|nr:2-dehydropantoate 2-reductase family protein [Bacillus clarus]
MKIGVVGPGAIGLLYAFYFKKNKQDVTLFTRTVEQAEKFMQTGIICMRDGKQETVFPRVLPIENMLDERLDYTFIAVKQYHLSDILPFVQEKPAVVFLQNGMSHLHVMEALSCESVAIGMVEHGAKKENEYTIRHAGIGVTKFGLVRGEYNQFEAMFNCFPSRCFSYQIEDDWKQTMCNKLIVNVCINPLTALLGVQNGELISNPFFYKTMEQVFLEVSFLISDQKKESLWKMVCQVCEKTSNNTSSMLADIKEKRQTEINAIVGYVIEEAEKQQKQVPTLQFLYNAIKGLEA